MNVLAMMRKEFNVDDNRTYLMGHSMGGAGTYFLGSKHAKEWAAIAPIAPASFLMNNNRTMILQGIKDGGVPMLVVQGDVDEAVPVANTRMWVDTMKEMKMDFEYKEIPGAKHGPVIEAGMGDIFTFFAKHTKAVRGQRAGGAAAQAAPAAGRGAQPPDPRVQQRTYHFADTKEDIPYAVFVSSKVTKAKKNPLIIALHGLGGSPNSLMRSNTLDLAEEGGFIVFAPMGYNPRGWYGIPWDVPQTPGVAPKLDPAAANDPPKLRELSEKDVMNVLAMARKEFNIDERRTYLMGHSMGGAGALYLGSKYSSNWAAIAAIAPAARRMETNMQPVLTPIKNNMPVIIIQGDADTAVPVANTRKWIAAMKDMKMNYKYDEIPGGDHGSVIGTGMPDIFAFFNEYTKR
jgi:predicted peptidase